MKGVTPKELSDLYRDAEAEGCTLATTRNGHVVIHLPNGRKCFGPKTAGDLRSVLNLRSQLRGLGLALKRSNR